MNAEQLLSANDFDLDRAFVDVLDGQQKQLGYNSRLVSDLASLVRCRMKYIERTKNRSKSHELEFLTQEQHIWDLLDVISRIRPSDPPALQCSTIKAFIETLPSSDTSKAEDMVAEVEEEIRELVKKNRLFANARAPKSSEEFEKLNERIIRSIRHGNHKEAIEISENEDEPWRTMLLTRYLEDMNKAKAGGRVDWLPDQRTAWRKTYGAILSRDGLGQYEAALHGIITGDTTHVLPVCRSWEDVIWTYYNARVQEAIENEIYDSDKRPLYLLTDEFVNMARNKDDSIRDTNLSFFHNTALAILTGSISRLITSLNIAKSFDMHTREHVLRCIAALIVYYNEHMKEQMTKEANDIIRLYAELNGKPNTLRPKNLAYYASHLPKTAQIELVSDFLSNYSWDEDERSILFDMGRQFELHIVSIARRTASKEINAYLEEEANSAQRPRAIRFDDDISERAKRCLRSFKWLLMDEALYFDAVFFANQLIQHALATNRSQLAETVLTAVPVSVTNLCMLQLGRKASKKLPEELSTLEKYRQLLLSK